MSKNIENGWYIEKNEQWPGEANAIQVKKVLYNEPSKFQVSIYQDLMPQATKMQMRMVR